MTIRVQLISKKKMELTDKILKETYESWRKSMYAPISDKTRSQFKCKSFVKIMTVYTQEIYTNIFTGTTHTEMRHRMLYLDIQSWHFRKARVKSAQKILSVLCLRMGSIHEYRTDFDKIIETGTIHW